MQATTAEWGGAQTKKKKNQRKILHNCFNLCLYIWFLEIIHNRPWRKSCQMAIASNAGWNTSRKANLPEKAACWQSSRIQSLKHPNLHCLPPGPRCCLHCMSLTNFFKLYMHHHKLSWNPPSRITNLMWSGTIILRTFMWRKSYLSISMRQGFLFKTASEACSMW